MNKKLSDHFLLTVALNFTYNRETKVTKVKNPYTTKVYEYNLFDATESDWKRFDTVLKGISIDFEEETKNEKVEAKLAKVYENVERATHIVFKKKKDFEDEAPEENGKKMSKNKIPLKIRTLLKRNSPIRYCPQLRGKKTTKP